jgi:hypothetical protein
MTKQTVALNDWTATVGMCRRNRAWNFDEDAGITVEPSHQGTAA